MIPFSEIEIFVTAGGKSSRMGQDKGLIEIAGKPMIKHVLDMLKANNLTHTIIANNVAYLKLNTKCIADIIHDKGPMGALYTALATCNKSMILLIGCDSPFIPFEAINRLIQNAHFNQITVAKLADKLNPLLAIYPKNIIQNVLNCIENNKLKMQDIIFGSLHQIIEMDDLLVKYPNGFVNLNEPNDLIRWRT